MAAPPGPTNYRDSEEDLDPRYATESYQHQTSQPLLSSSSTGRNDLVFDAATDLESQQTSQPHQFGSGANYSRSLGGGGPIRLPGGEGGGGGGFGSGSGGLTQSFNTAINWSLSNVCFIAWTLPPFSSVLVLVWETENDLARFHAYQSGICGVLLILALWIVRSWLGLKTIGLLLGMAALGWFWVCGSTAHKSAPTLSRNPYLPHIGDVAARWVGEE
ncbi:hypothetical protein IE53DRAFT_402920 [Violaceomyces palustris]|uniref:Uncharacterized protein n=1 Tax=Violaceomyces palustris TaxID=1673888 RepID=A0ACD0P3E0_9BASI|nr:hypothetical protein IE53DRAFT_402920 [Violaceomyces palustris]